jgi:hypothetical protein
MESGLEEDSGRTRFRYAQQSSPLREYTFLLLRRNRLLGTIEKPCWQGLLSCPMGDEFLLSIEAGIHPASKCGSSTSPLGLSDRSENVLLFSKNILLLTMGNILLNLAYKKGFN